MVNMPVICGAEEPLSANGWLYALEEDSSTIGLEGPGDPRLNRYSFLWLGNMGSGAADANTLLDYIRAYLDMPLFLISAWSLPDDATENVRRILREKMADVKDEANQHGWEIDATQEKTLVAKPDIDPKAPLTLSDWNHSLLLGGTPDPLAVLQEADAAPFLHRFSSTGTAAPNQKLFDGIVRNGLVLVYRARELNSAFALILISRQKLPVRILLQEGILSELYEGRRAADIWSIAEHRMQTSG